MLSLRRAMILSCRIVSSGRVSGHAGLLLEDRVVIAAVYHKGPASCQLGKLSPIEASIWLQPP